MNNYEKKFANGVYLKPSGHLAVVYVDTVDDKKSWCVDEGKVIKNKLGALRFDVPVVMRSSSPYLGWGPSNFLNKSEYLGEL